MGMIRQVKSAVVMLAVMTVITGVIYPLAITGIAQLAFASQANGSLIVDPGGRLAGSRLIGQPFDRPGYFWGRPSATSPYPYNAAASSGSNLGPANPVLLQEVEARARALRDADPGNTAPIPVDLVTASGSGLDPHISPAAAEYQVARVARARGLDESRVRELVRQNTGQRALGILGEPCVDVLALNLALNRLP